eukprot:225480-Chlamydomonas_euryale.AAC.2
MVRACPSGRPPDKAAHWPNRALSLWPPSRQGGQCPRAPQRLKQLRLAGRDVLLGDDRMHREFQDWKVVSKEDLPRSQAALHAASASQGCVFIEQIAPAVTQLQRWFRGGRAR